LEGLKWIGRKEVGNAEKSSCGCFGVKGFKEDVRENLAEETEAKKGYFKLARQLRAKGFKSEARTVGSIARDEKEHFVRFSKIRQRLKK